MTTTNLTRASLAARDRAQGLSLRAIANKHGYSDAPTARRAILRHQARQAAVKAVAA